MAKIQVSAACIWFDDDVELTEERSALLAAMKSRWTWLNTRDYFKTYDEGGEQGLSFKAEDSSRELEALAIADGKLPKGWSIGSRAESWVEDFLTDLLRLFGNDSQLRSDVEFSDQYGESLETGWKARLDDEGNLQIAWYA